MKISLTTTYLLFLSASVYGWGQEGHRLTGYVAQKFLTQSSITSVANLLSDEKYNGKLEMGTLWADSIKFAMKWSAQLHFVDIQSEFEKAGNCEYQSDRDCPNGNCVVGAIANYSRQLVTGCSALDGTATSLFKTARSNFVLPLANRKPPRPNVSPPSPPNTTQALLFLIHFMGDVTQPLHACAKDRGGNDDKAKFGKTTTNLHSVWDSSIPKQRISEFGTFQAYGDHLASRLGSGDFAGEKSSWVSSLTTDTLRQNIDNDWSVPADWAQDSGDIDCSSVLWSGYLSDPGQDLLTSGYYETVAPIADKQIAKAGFRMATLLNMIFDKSRNCV